MRSAIGLLTVILCVALPAPSTLAAGDARDLAPSATAPTNVSLTPEALARLREQVLVQCGLRDKPTEALPWYFHFEFGRRLLDAGDARRAVGYLAHAVELNPEPNPEKRMYGQWYTDYLPYGRLARAHARLGNWPCAAKALTLARAYGEGEAPTGAPLEDLQSDIDAHRGEIGACHPEGDDPLITTTH